MTQEKQKAVLMSIAALTTNHESGTFKSEGISPYPHQSFSTDDRESNRLMGDI
ncbi:MAG TPA: hypothetical protein V6C91_23395 [Coleofasciculaceae cyanobacterium]